MGDLKKLKELILEGNQLVSLPRKLGQLENLETFFSQKNQLTSVPKEIGQLKRPGGLAFG